MALRRTGVQLVAQDGSEYIAVLERAGRATADFGNDAAKIAAKIASTTDKIDHQKRALGILQQELDQTAAKYGASSTQAQRKQLALDKLTASIARDEQALERLRQEEAAAARSAGQFGDATENAAKDVDKAGKVMTGALERVGHIAVDALVSAGQALAGAIGSAVSGAADYEQAMNVLQAQSGASADEMARVKETAKALGADLTLPATSAADAGQAMLELSKGGLSVEQAMAAAKGTLQLAAAAETDVATAANITTGALSAFGMEGSQAVYIADLMANAANQSRASITDLGAGFQQAAFRMKSAGQGADDLAASLAILTNNGLTGSDAGTALQNAIARLQAPTDRAAGLMAELGINVYDANGAMLPMSKIIGVFNEKLGGMTQQQRNAALSTIFLSDGMKAMIPLMASGTSGFDTMKEKVNAGGAAAQMAGAQMQGLHGAVAGLGSQLETLALEALEPLLPLMSAVLQHAAAWAGSFVGQVGPAVQGFADGLVAITPTLLGIGDAIVNGVVPALATLTAATVVYALVHLPSLIASLAASSTAFLANHAAMLTSAGAFAVIGLAIAAVVSEWNDFSDTVASATEHMLSSKPFWQESAAAIDRLGQASAETKTKLQPLADSIQMQRDLLESHIESLGKRMAAGLVSDAQYQQEMAANNGLALAIEFATGQLNAQMQAEVNTAAAGLTATNQATAMAGAEAHLAEQTALTTEELEKLAKELEKVFAAGSKAVQDYVTTAIAFEAKLTDAIKTGSAEQAADAAASYAEQAAAARASIGEQLSAYTMAQMQLGNISREQAGVVLQAIEKEFGATQSIAASTFLEMEQTIDTFAQNGGASADALGSDLDALAQDAITSKEKMDALATRYEAELIQNFKDGTIDADELRRALEKIPAKVYTQVTVSTKFQGGTAIPGMPARAIGGPVRSGQPYLVGENGPEIFTPRRSGRIISNEDATGGSGGGGGGSDDIVAGAFALGAAAAAAMADGFVSQRIRFVAAVAETAQQAFLPFQEQMRATGETATQIGQTITDAASPFVLWGDSAGKSAQQVAQEVAAMGAGVRSDFGLMQAEILSLVAQQQQLGGSAGDMSAALGVIFDEYFGKWQARLGSMSEGTAALAQAVGSAGQTTRTFGEDVTTGATQASSALVRAGQSATDATGPFVLWGDSAGKSARQVAQEVDGMGADVRGDFKRMQVEILALVARHQHLGSSAGDMAAELGIIFDEYFGKWRARIGSMSEGTTALADAFRGAGQATADFGEAARAGLGDAEQFAAIGLAASTAFAGGFADGHGAIAQTIRHIAEQNTDSFIRTVRQGTEDASDFVSRMLREVREQLDATFGGGQSQGASSPFMRHGPDGASSPFMRHGRASGGPVRRGSLYLVGERGPELFAPGLSGTIIPNHRIAPPASPQQINQQRITQATYNMQRTYNYAPTYANAPRRPQQDFGLMQAFES